MDSGNKKTVNKKTGKTSMSITKKETQQPKSKKDDISSQQNYDADAELALALSTSEETHAQSAHADTGDFERQQQLTHLKQQEEADAEYARQLSDEFASAAIPESGNGGDDMDAVLEEIAKMEAQERLQASGHAYNAKTNISRILADEDEEESRIREKVKRDSELREWHEERARQDAAFAAAAEHDRLQELSNKAIRTSIPEPKPQSAPASDLQEEPEPEPEPIPLSKEELRRARLAFFTPTNLMPKS